MYYSLAQSNGQPSVALQWNAGLSASFRAAIMRASAGSLGSGLPSSLSAASCRSTIMAFPEVQRVRYRQNPLEEVICQLRFPPILRIDTELPVAFQEQIRTTYPLYRSVIQGQQALGTTTKMGSSPDLSYAVRIAHQFASDENSTWTITVEREFFAIKTTRYIHWEEFSVRLVDALNSFKQIYRPSYYSRIGLRYIDVIQRSKLGLESRSWGELLSQAIAGELAIPEVAGEIENVMRHTAIRLSQHDSLVRLRHGLVSEQSTGESCFFIDSDFFHEQITKVEDAHTILEYFRKNAGYLFRWCIQPLLHDALGPVPI